MKQYPSIGFIGAGNMTSALAGGMIANGTPTQAIMLSDINAGQLKHLATKLGVKTTQHNHELVEVCSVLVLAVKPQVMQGLVTELKPLLQQKKPLLISIAAGITVSMLNKWIDADLAIIRCMPNTPALVGKAASALFANNAVSSSQRQSAESILQAVGIVEWLDEENKIDAVTALSGSGPAYFFLMMEAMIDSAIEQGLSEDSAKNLVMQTALGAATMAQQADVGLAELRKRVTSPGGTTEAALNSFSDNDYRRIIKQAMDAARKRSIELSQE